MSDVIIPYRYLVLGNTAAFLASENGIARAREMVVETDTGRLKLGDGATAYNSLPYINLPGPSFRYTSDTGSTADSDPGAGLFKWNNATQSSATFLYFDDETADTGTDLSAFFSELSASNDSGIIHLANEFGHFQLWKWTAITDGTGYFKFAVNHLVSSASFADDVSVSVLFLPQGAAGGGGGGDWTTVKKITDESRNTTATLADDSALLFSCSSATRYQVRMKVFVTTANATMDFKFGIAYSGTHTSAFMRWVAQVPGAGAGTDNENTFSTASLVSSQALLAATFGPCFIEVDVTILTDSSGTLSFQWAQNTSNASDATVLAGSYLEHMTIA